MNPFYQNYAAQLFQHYRLYANFPPQKKAVIGDIGILDGRLYKRQDSLKNLIGFPIQSRTNQPDGSRTNIDSHMNFGTNNSIDIKYLSKGEADLINAGIEVKLKNQNSFYFNLAGVVIEEIDNQLTLAGQILDLYKKGIWKKEWVVVTTVLKAQTSLIFGSSTGNSTITLEAKADVPGIQLNDASLELVIKRMTSVEMNIVDNDNLTPLLEIAQIKRKLIGRPSFGFSEEPVLPDEELIEVIRTNNRDIKDYFEFAII